MLWMANMGFWRKRSTPPGEGTFDVVARARVEPLGVAPSPEASGTFTVTAVARVEPVGAVPPVPAAPTNNAVAFGHTFVGALIVEVDGTLAHTWTNNDPDNTDTIRVQSATNAGFTENLLDLPFADGSLTQVSHPAQFDGVTRYYRVRAENGSGPSAWSNVVSVKHIANVPGEAQNLDGNAPSATSIQVTWDAPPDGGPVDHYRVEFLEGPDDETADLSATFGGLDPATAYGFRVRAIGPDNQAGDRTDIVTQATRHQTPGLEGCVDTPDPTKPASTVDRLLITDNATENTSIRIERNGGHYDAENPGNRTYTPATQDGSWRVQARGGIATHPNGNTPIPDSAYSPTRTMPFEGSCAQP